MDPTIQRLEQLAQMMTRPVVYTGEANITEIEKFLNNEWERVGKFVFEGTGFTPDRQMWDETKKDLRKGFAEQPVQFTEELRRGVGQTVLLGLLANDRFGREVGYKCEAKAGGKTYSAPVTFDPSASAPFGCYGTYPPVFYMNVLGLLMFDKKEKQAAMYHEMAHVVLGHLDEGFTLPDDRRKIEHDANYVGSLFHRDTSGLISFFRKKIMIDEYERTHAHLYNEIKQEAYRQAGKTSEKEMESAFSDVEKGHAAMSKWIYPTKEERIASLIALQQRLDEEDVRLGLAGLDPETRDKVWQRRIDSAVAERHIQKDNSTGRSA